MAFNRKFWKRGDKLKVADLNRIEEGIVSSSETISSSINFIQVNLNNLDTIEQGGTGTPMTDDNFSITINEIVNKLLNHELIILEITDGYGFKYISYLSGGWSENNTITGFYFDPCGMSDGYNIKFEIENNIWSAAISEVRFGS